jgi:hypothetical protein
VLQYARTIPVKPLGSQETEGGGNSGESRKSAEGARSQGRISQAKGQSGHSLYFCLSAVLFFRGLRSQFFFLLLFIF